MDDIERAGLKLIFALLEPMGDPHIQEHCEGCAFEQNEALSVAMNMLSGLEPEAHRGPVHTRDEMAACRENTCDKCRAWKDEKLPAVREAWEKAGFFEQTPGVWTHKELRPS